MENNTTTATNKWLTTKFTVLLVGTALLASFHFGKLYGTTTGMIKGELSACNQITGGVNKFANIFSGGAANVGLTCAQENNKTFISLNIQGQTIKLNLDLSEATLK